MRKYNIGEVWWVHFPFSDKNIEKRRPAIIVDNETIAILAMYVTSKNKDNPYSIQIEDWKEAGLPVQSWTRIDRIVSMSEWNMDKKIGNLSQKDLTKIMQLVAEIIQESFHDFSIIAIQNPKGEYLQKYDERWECWLFPYVKSNDANKENVDAYVSELLCADMSTEYVTNAKHCKYSASDKVYKIYNHKLYRLLLDSVPNDMKEDSFSIMDSEYCWMSIEKMESNLEIMEKNDDIVAFIKAKCK